MPLTDRDKAKESGFAQVRKALLSFEGDVISAEFDKWGGKLLDDDGKPLPPREFLGISCIGVKVLTTSEELSMPVDEWNFRVNCSDYKGSFWVEAFLESADKHKLLIPDDLVGKRIVWEKYTLEAVDKDGTRKPQFDSTNYIIKGIIGDGVAPGTVPQPAPDSPTEDPMVVATDLAVGKTETQFRSACNLHPAIVGTPLLAMIKAGMFSKSLVEQGVLVEVTEGNKTIYRRA